MKKDIDKLKNAITILLDVWPAFEKIGKASKWYQYIIPSLAIIFKHFGKLKSIIKSIKEIWEEIKDIDRKEAEELFNIIAPVFGGSNQIKLAISKLCFGCVDIYDGIMIINALKQSK